ncbi:putative capsid protein [Freshwater macrophyte associated alphaflexi-like virus 1]|nr:putative capsid protein [Freshwater macrophyte associated alphaflexi-like virus 1]
MPLPAPSLAKNNIQRWSAFIASDDMVNAVVNALTELQVPDNTGKLVKPLKDATPEQFSNTLFAFAVYCADNGASDKATFLGDYTPSATAPANVPFSSVADAVKRQCTIRQFCGYYAQNVWNYLLSTGPPMNWEKKGFTPATKYAAFDFFDAVSIKTAVSPISLLREPTLDELNANKTNAHAAIVNARASEGSILSTRAVVHGGRSTSSTAKFNFPYNMPAVSAP